MILNIKIMNGAEHQLEVGPEETIAAVKALLADKLQVPASQQRLLLKGKPLLDTGNIKDYSIEPGTKIHLVIKKEGNESSLTRELKTVGAPYFADVDRFATIFNQELKKLVGEMSLDDIEYYDGYRSSLAAKNEAKPAAK